MITGFLDLNTHLWNRLTAEGDFVPSHSIDAVLANEEQRYLAVVKKNGARLKALKNWLFGARPELLAKCPVLIIDDEADQATVNTGKPGDSPKAINSLIRAIVNGASKSAYVGYTATPFANVLIDPTDYEDLYPRDFIVNLPRPKGYFGAETIFGREPLPHETDSVGVEGHDLVRHIPDDELKIAAAGICCSTAVVRAPDDAKPSSGVELFPTQHNRSKDTRNRQFSCDCPHSYLAAYRYAPIGCRTY